MLRRVGRRAGLWVGNAALGFFYVLGMLAAFAVVTVLTVVAAVRLGWSDVRRGS